MPGVISHATNIVEHPKLVARWLIDWAAIVGRENVVGGRLRHGRPGACRDWLVKARRARRRGGSRDENLVALNEPEGRHLVQISKTSGTIRAALKCNAQPCQDHRSAYLARLPTGMISFASGVH
jgi:hypothetical protein